MTDHAQMARELSAKLWHITHCQPRECICNMACVGDFQEMEAATIPAITQAHAAGRRDEAETERIEWVRRAERAEERAEELQATLTARENELCTAKDQIPPDMEEDSLSVVLIKLKDQRDAAVQEAGRLREVIYRYGFNHTPSCTHATDKISKDCPCGAYGLRDKALRGEWTEALGNLACEVCKIDMQRALGTQQARGSSGGAANHYGGKT